MNPNPLSVFRLIVPVIDAIRAYLLHSVRVRATAPLSITRFDAEIRLIGMGISRDRRRTTAESVSRCRTRATSTGAFWRPCAFAALGTCRSVPDEDAPWRCAWRGDSSGSVGRRTCRGPCRARSGCVALHHQHGLTVASTSSASRRDAGSVPRRGRPAREIPGIVSCPRPLVTSNPFGRPACDAWLYRVPMFG